MNGFAGGAFKLGMRGFFAGAVSRPGEQTVPKTTCFAGGAFKLGKRGFFAAAFSSPGERTMPKTPPSFAIPFPKVLTALLQETKHNSKGNMIHNVENFAFVPNPLRIMALML